MLPQVDIAAGYFDAADTSFGILELPHLAAVARQDPKYSVTSLGLRSFLHMVQASSSRS